MKTAPHMIPLLLFTFLIGLWRKKHMQVLCWLKMNCIDLKCLGSIVSSKESRIWAAV
jgi:hypothetical protein